MVLIIWLSALFAVSVLPVSGPTTELPADKIEHFVAYGITALLFFRHFVTRQYRRTFRLSVIAASAFGAAMEVVQSFVPYRQCSFGDMAANASGALVFSVIYWLWRRE
jgi:VanZ family protein